MEINKTAVVFCLNILLWAGLACQSTIAYNKNKQDTQQSSFVADTIAESKVLPKPQFCQKMENLGLVEIQTLEPNIRVFAPYGTTENFTHTELYDTYQYAYFQPDVALMIQKAYQYLQEEKSGCTFLIWDGARPLSVQTKMWTIACQMDKKCYVSNPKNTGLHNYGAAVDLTLVDSLGNKLDMGTDFDFFGEAAHTDKEKILLDKGILTAQQVANRQLLRRVMKKAGFSVLPTEWWHFNACSRITAKQKYQLID
ncbi:MAG: M15 family metallopeptidase [Bacteroidales bacterium]|nr:M15 family metallopeptidase [Bacteroidales bacterium]